MKEIELFVDTPKPKSTKKAADREAFTPLKLKPIQKLFASLVGMKDEIIQDGKQAATALNQSQHVGHVDHVVRLLLDLPSYRMKSLFIKSLRAISKYSLVFSMSLQEQLNKEYFALKQQPELNEDQQAFLEASSSLINKIVGSSSADTKEELISSLAFPFIQFSLSSA